MWPLVQWWLMLEGLGLVALPLLFPLFGPNLAHGYPFAKIAAALLLTYLSWLLGFVVPMSAALYGTLGALALVAVAAAWAQRTQLAAWLREGGARAILSHNGLWTAGFLFFAWQRSLAPDIFGAEKYMDFAFFNVLTRTGTMPPYDPWMAGETINYYYFGYLLYSNLARLAALPNFISYNLCVVTVGGMAFGLTGAVVYGLTRRWGIAVLGGALSAILGNLDGFLQFTERGTLRGMNYWRSTRVVGADGATINEFPFFSTIHGDLHPHFMVLPVSLLLLAILLEERLFPSRPEEQPQDPWRALLPFAVATFVLGAVVAISPWELPIGVVVVFLLAGRWQALTPLFTRQRVVLGIRIAAVIGFAYLLYLPFYIGFTAPTATPGPNETCIGSACFKLAETSLREFLTVFGLMLFPPVVLVVARSWSILPGSRESRHLLLALTGLMVIFTALVGNGVLPLLAALVAGSLLVAYGDCEGPERAGFLLVTAAGLALLACEFLYLKDSYGDRLYRMNTVFKLYFQAWTILAIATPWCVDRLLRREWQWKPAPYAVSACLAVLVAAAACYPIGVSLDRGGVPIKTLNGNAYLQREHPDDYAAIEWLRANAEDTPVLLEATGNPYSYYARFSANTGLPAVLGWANHEGLWRAHDRDVLARHNTVRQVYNAPTLGEVEPFLDRHHVKYILVGDLERKEYKPEGLQKFAALDVAFRSGGTVIYRR